MTSPWPRMPFSEAVELNPRRPVARGTLTPFVDMAALPTETREVRPFRMRPVGGGGSRFTNGDTLFARITPCTENGKAGLVDCLAAGEVATGSTEFIVLGPRPNLTIPRFIYYLAKNPRFRSFAISQMRGTSGRQRVPANVFDDFEIGVPPLSEQDTIATILSSVDDAIEKTQAVIDQVQVVKQGLMQELLTRGLPGRHTRFKQTEMGKIPEDWPLVRIEQVGVVEAGRQRSPKAQGKPRPYLRVANVYDGYIDTTSFLFMPFSESEFARLKLVPGDLLLNEGQSRELVGRCAQYFGEPRDCCFQNTLIRFQAGDHIRTRFAFWVFRHYFYSGVFSAISRQTTSIAHLGVSRFANLKLALPDLEEQSAIVERLEALNVREEVERCWLAQLCVVKSALMSVLLTGELRVIADGKVA